jgi:hypothetical protein
VPQGGSLLLVRVPIINDTAYEGAHAFTLTATASNAVANGIAIIGDFGTGAIFNDSGAENRFAVKNDDRQLKVDSPIVNEASDYVVYQVTGITANDTELALTIDNGTGFATITPNLQYWTGSNWQTYAGETIAKPNNGELLVRVNIQEEQDDIREGWERLDLVVRGSGGPAVGCASIRDDGSGVIYEFAQSGNTAPVTTTIENLDDDFDKDGILPTTEDALASLAASQGIGSAKDGDMNGDGVADADQNALATLAWTDVKSFDAGNAGTLTDSKPIISITITDNNNDTRVSQTAQLENIRVTSFTDNSAFDNNAINSVTYANPADNSGIRTVTLADGSSTQTPWDPIKFNVVSQATGGVLNDIDLSRTGIQVRLYIDISAAGLNQGEFNSYIKYVSQLALDDANASQKPLIDLDGKTITKAGWYDFTQRTPNGDGARFIINNGKIVGIELIITDNTFGDDDMRVDRIFDPGVPVKAASTENDFSPNVSQIVDFNGASGLHPHPVTSPLFNNFQINNDGTIHNENDKWSPTLINWPGINLNHNIDQFHQAWGETRSEILEVSLSAINKNGVFKLPPEALMGLDTNDSLKFDASLADGNELPDWILFDRNSGSVALAKDAPIIKDSTKITIVATDTKSNQVTVKVILKPKLSSTDAPIEKKSLSHSVAVKQNDKPIAKQSLTEQIRQTSGSQRLQRDASDLLNSLSQVFR